MHHDWGARHNFIICYGQCSLPACIWLLVIMHSANNTHLSSDNIEQIIAGNFHHGFQRNPDIHIRWIWKSFLVLFTALVWCWVSKFVVSLSLLLEWHNCIMELHDYSSSSINTGDPLHSRTQPCPIVDTAVPSLFTQPCHRRTMSTAVCIYVAGLCAHCLAV